MSCAFRHVLDDTSGRSSQDDGKGLQYCSFGKDDTVLDTHYSECKMCFQCLNVHKPFDVY